MSAAEPINVAELSVEDLVSKFGRKPGDTGLAEVQIALLTKRIESLSHHMKKFVNDIHTSRGMMKIISKRKGLLSYLKEESVDRYRALILQLGLRK